MTCPADVTEIDPPYEQVQLHESVRAGYLLIKTDADPGVQGVVTGIQGIGVRVPRAAAVAAATTGFDGD